MWSIGDVFDSLADQLQGLFEMARDEGEEGGLTALLRPIDPFNRSTVLTPLVSVAGVVGVLMLSGVAIGALATTIAALLALYFLLTQVFGYEISLAVPAAS